jgi:MscS family membrane protein
MMMLPRPMLAWCALLLAGLPIPALAQTGTQTAQASAPAAQAADSLGRDTPRGTIAGFNLAVHREDFVSAFLYLQMTAAQRPNAERLARDLTELIDRHFAVPITTVSNTPEGVLNDGLPADRERVVLTIRGKPADIGLVRVDDRQAGPVWLIASQTLAEVPALRRSSTGTGFERYMPEALVESTLFGIPIARWLVWAATFVIPFAILWCLSRISMVLGRRTIRDPAHRRLLETLYGGLRWLLILVLTLAIHLTFLPSLGFSLRFRYDYARMLIAAAVVIAAILLWRILALSFEHARIMAQRKGQGGFRSLLMLSERVSKIIIILVAIFALLTVAGVDTTTALAGLGIGGVAVALGAQKTVENLLGGVFLITDRVLAVGDTCSISNRVGVVEDITMRSVRLRTIEQTLLSVPTGILSQSTVENFATRDKILVQSTLRLRYETTADQLRRVLSGIRARLDEHPDIETATARIRLVDFGMRAIELELFAYVLTADLLKFLAIREDLLLQIATVVESSGTSFAQPTLVYQEPTADAGVGVRAAETP